MQVPKLSHACAFIPFSNLAGVQHAGLGLAALLVGASTGVPSAGAATGSAVEVMRLRFGDKLRRASKMLDELQQDIFNDVSTGFDV